MRCDAWSPWHRAWYSKHAIVLTITTTATMMRRRRRRRKRGGGGGEGKAYGFLNSVRVETQGCTSSLVSYNKVHSVTKKEKPQGVNLTTEWFEEKRVHEMLVFLGGEMRILLSMVNQCELEGGKKRQSVAELDSLHNLWPTLSVSCVHLL